jgi:hypothetical protein
MPYQLQAPGDLNIYLPHFSFHGDDTVFSPDIDAMFIIRNSLGSLSSDRAVR